MDGLRQWAICLIVASFAGAFVMIVSPRGSMDKTIRAVAGVFVVAALCSPIAELKNLEFSFADSEMYSDENEYSPKAEDKLVEIYANAVAQRVNELAEEAGTQADSVDAEVSVDENGCIIIHKISVEITESDLAKELARTLKEKLGVPVTVEVK